jgi:hypothetical protein
MNNKIVQTKAATLKNLAPLKALALIVSVLLCTQVFAPLAHALTDDIHTTDEGCVHKFADILEHSLEEEICHLYEEGVINGDDNGRNYYPSNQITRAEFLKISLRVVGYNVVAVQSAVPNDVSAGDWHYQYVTYAMDRGFVKGYEDGSFRPNEPITRSEAVVMIMGIAEIAELGEDETSEIANTYTDLEFEDWYTPAIAVADSLEIVQGYGTGYFAPHAYITRSESAAVASRTFDTLYTDQ